ncbi:MAG TPA: ABC transporter permease [Candidatus Limnocylindrales bacterium]|jgi:ABC-type dipeptide/oligopeptide/nickel transport system permease subunit|nr:ABC transporter permease [Candidatus Limnocylindrales bacterium]
MSVTSEPIGGGALPAGTPGAALPAAIDDPLARTRPSSLWRDTIANVLRQRSAVVGLLILSVLLLSAVFAPVIATHDPNASMLQEHEQGAVKRSAPCIHALGCAADKPQHLLGLDGNFRDVFSRVIYGARVSLGIGFASVFLAILVGTLVGAIAGYAGGWVDNILMRLMDVILAFPSLLLAIAIVSALGRNLFNALLAIGIVAIPVYARIVRSQVLSLRESDFVTASRALGETHVGILTRRILPNSLTPIVVQGTLGIGGAVLEIAALTFVGVAGSLDVPEWGSMISVESQQLFNAPHVILVPGLAITLTVLGFNLLGDGLRDALDPRLNR